MKKAPGQFPVFNAMQNEFMPFKDVWQAPAHLKRDQTRLKYTAIFRRFQGASSDQASVIKAQQSPIPMWIADMDIPPCDTILSAITQNLRSSYGYQSLDIGEAVAKRFERNTPKTSRFKVESDDVVDVASVIGAVDISLRTFCQAGHKVMVFTPTYSPLIEAIKSNRLKPVYLPVTREGYSVESKETEAPFFDGSAKGEDQNLDNTDLSINLTALDPSASAFVICHPNNPTGTVLNAEEQRVILDFCARHNILIITDEVHSDFAFNSSNEPTLIPMFGAEVSPSELKKNDSLKAECSTSYRLPRIIHLNSVSKAFNLASVPGASYAVIKDKKTKEIFAQAVNSRHLNASNLGKVALIAAYQSGSTWLDYVKSALSFNRKLVHRFFKYYGVTVNYTMGSAGYFLWLDLSSFSTRLTQPLTSALKRKDSLDDDTREVLKYSPVSNVEACIERGVIGNDGAPFGAPDHIRLNLACHPMVIETALQRLCFVS